jgi:hypothetical protein
MILFEKFGQYQPLNRRAERYAREGAPLSLSTLADQVGACCAVLAPLLKRVEAHVFAAERWHGADTTVPVLATRSHMMIALSSLPACSGTHTQTPAAMAIMNMGMHRNARANDPVDCCRKTVTNGHSTKPTK